MQWTRAFAIAVSSVLAPVAVAFAAIPTDGVITACYSKSGGTLRVIDPTVTNCKANETSLTWAAGGAAAPVSGYEIVTNSEEVAAGTNVLLAGLSVSCTSGKNVLGGGAAFSIDSEGDGTYAATSTWSPFNSAPTGDGAGWAITYGTGFHPDAARVTVYAICADVAP